MRLVSKGRTSVAMVRQVVVPMLLSARWPFGPICKEGFEAEVVLNTAEDINKVPLDVIRAVGVDVPDIRIRSLLQGPGSNWCKLELRHIAKFGRADTEVHV